MSATWRSLLRDERGFVITAELVLISTVLVVGLVAALSAVKTALAGELGDVANAIGSTNQSYYTHGFHGHGSRVYGSSFLDEADSSDEEKADFATGVQDCRSTVAVKQSVCTTPPCNPPCEIPCPQPCQTPCPQPCETPCPQPCNGCPPTLPAPIAADVPCAAPCGAPCGTPCESPCGTPCGAAVAAPCGSPCGTQVAAGYGAPYGPAYGSSGGCGSSYQLIEGWSRFGVSVPSVICPPGPGPFTGTDPFAPGVVSPKNMYLQGISYRGVCAPPADPSAIPAPCPNPELPAFTQGSPVVQYPHGQLPPASPIFDPALEEATHPTGYEAPSEPAFLPPQGRRGTVY